MNNKVPVYRHYLVVAIPLLVFGTVFAAVQFKVPTIMGAIIAQPQFSSLADGSASWLMSLFTFIGIILSIPVGAFAKKFGPKVMLIAAAVILIIGSIIGAFSNTGGLLIGSRAVEGAAVIIAAVCGPLAIQRYVAPEKVGSGMGIWAIWLGTGSFVGETLSPSLYSSLGFSGVWLFFAGLTLVVTVVIIFILREPTKKLAPGKGEAAPAAAEADKNFSDVSSTGAGQADGALSAPSASAPSAPKEKQGYTSLLKPSMILHLAGWVIFNMMFLSMLTFTPQFLQQQGIDHTLSGFVSTLPTLLPIITLPILGMIYDKTGKIKIFIVIPMIIMGICVFTLMNVTGPLTWVAVVIMGLFGLCAPVMYINGLSRIVGREDLMPVAMGLFILTQSIGQFLGTALPPLLLGAELTNWLLTGSVLGIIAIAGAIWMAFVRYDPK